MAGEHKRPGRRSLMKAPTADRVKNRTRTAFLCLLAAFLLSGCFPPYESPEDVSSTATTPTPDATTHTSSPTLPQSNTGPSGSSISCVSIGWPIEDVSRVAGFPLTSVADIPNGCVYSTDPSSLATQVEISLEPISNRASFETVFTRLSSAAIKKGSCAWETTEHLAFTCTGTFGATEAFKGASISMVLLKNHAVHFVAGTHNADFASSAEAAARKLARQAQAHDRSRHGVRPAGHD